MLASLRVVVLITVLGVLAACAGKPMIPYSAESPVLVLLPANRTGIDDDRGRFREVFCAVLEARRETLPDYRRCADALSPVVGEPPATGNPVALEPARSDLLVGMVPGLGWDCFSNWLDLDDSALRHLSDYGYELRLVPVGGLSSSAENARYIRDWVRDVSDVDSSRRLVLLGYSKGTPDILEAIVRYPEVAARVEAVVSVAGAVGGSPLANDARQWQANLLTRVPGADCKPKAEHAAVEDLTTVVRKRWLAENSLPPSIRYYSIVTFPDPDRISSGLGNSYRRLSRIDGRNDSQVIFYDQIVPGSTLLAFINADHWAAAVPVARGHPLIGSTLVNHNDYPREALLEALLRYLEESLGP